MVTNKSRLFDNVKLSLVTLCDLYIYVIPLFKMVYQQDTTTYLLRIHRISTNCNASIVRF